MNRNKNTVLFTAGPPATPPPPPPPPLKSDLLTQKDPLAEARKRQAEANKAPKTETKKDNISEKLEKLGIDPKSIEKFSDIDKNIILSPLQFNKIDKAQGEEKNRLIQGLKDRINETVNQYEEKEAREKQSNIQTPPESSPTQSAPTFQGVPPPPPISGMKPLLTTIQKTSGPVKNGKSIQPNNLQTQQEKKPATPIAPEKNLNMMDELKNKLRKRSESPNSNRSSNSSDSGISSSGSSKNTSPISQNKENIFFPQTSQKSEVSTTASKTPPPVPPRTDKPSQQIPLTQKQNQIPQVKTTHRAPPPPPGQKLDSSQVGGVNPYGKSKA